MNSGLLLLGNMIPPVAEAAGKSNTGSYILGAIIALLIIGYLIYTLIRPEKF